MDGQNEIKEIDRLILKYLEGEASKDEKIELYRWIELSEENKTHFKEAQELWLSTQAILAPKEDTEKALRRFRSKIKNYNRHGKTFRKPLYYITQSAAIIVILLGLYYFFTRESNPEQYACVEMAIGNKGCITLPDSTVVWLNSGSKLTYPSRFSDKKEKSGSTAGLFQSLPQRRSTIRCRNQRYGHKVLDQLCRQELHTRRNHRNGIGRRACRSLFSQ